MNQYTVEHCIYPGFFNETLTKKVYDYCLNSIPKNIPKYQNYLPKNLKIEEHLIFSVLIKNDNIFAFSGIFNGGRYKKGIYRILNRMYVSRELRDGTLFSLRSDWHSFKIINEQIGVVNNYLDFIFVSMEEEKRLSVLPKIAKKISLPEKSEWRLEQSWYQVVTGEKRSCYQKIIWCSPNKSHNYCAFDSIDDNNYLKLPHF